MIFSNYQLHSVKGEVYSSQKHVIFNNKVVPTEDEENESLTLSQLRPN